MVVMQCWLLQGRAHHFTHLVHDNSSTKRSFVVNLHAFPIVPAALNRQLVDDAVFLSKQVHTDGYRSSKEVFFTNVHTLAYRYTAYCMYVLFKTVFQRSA